jgi:hypothetical protein
MRKKPPKTRSFGEFKKGKSMPAGTPLPDETLHNRVVSKLRDNRFIGQKSESKPGSVKWG